MTDSNGELMLTDFELFLLARAERNARGFHVWTKGKSWHKVQSLALRSLVRTVATEWGDQWYRVQITEKGERALLKASDGQS